MARARGSANTVAASSNDTPCFFLLEEALRGFQAKFTMFNVIPLIGQRKVRFYDLCLANIPSVRVVAISGAAAKRGHEAQDGREASEGTAELGSGQDSRVRSREAFGRTRRSARFSATPPCSRRSVDAGRRPEEG